MFICMVVFAFEGKQKLFWGDQEQLHVSHIKKKLIIASDTASDKR